MSTKEIRDYLIDSIMKIGHVAVVALDGHYFSGIDIAIHNKDGNPVTYRIAVVSHQSKIQKICIT